MGAAGFMPNNSTRDQELHKAVAIAGTESGTE
jgi:hypothetical protein